MAPSTQSSGDTEAVRARRLRDLRLHWDEAYEIWFDDRFRARRLDGRGCLEAGTARELGDLMLADYSTRPVRRTADLGTGTGTRSANEPLSGDRSAGDAGVSG